PFAESMNVGRDVSEILGEKWQTTQSLAQIHEKIVFRTIDPAAMNRGRLARRNLPELRKPAEMIEADIVEIVRETANPVDPPRISLLPHRVPAIKRIPPALAVFAERIRGHAGDDLGIEFGVQAKQFGVGPDIGAVEIHENRHVAHNVNRTLRAIGSKSLPLFEEKELHDAAEIEIVEHFPTRLFDRHRIAMNQFAGPSVPAFQL